MDIMAAATAALALWAAALADATSHYTVLFQERVAGSEVATVRGDGGVDVQMSYRNNGRGPDLKEHSRFAPDGTLLSFEVKGKSTFGAPIDESYTLKGDKARWRSQADRGEMAVTAPAVYVPVDSVRRAASAAHRWRSESASWRGVTLWW